MEFFVDDIGCFEYGLYWCVEVFELCLYYGLDGVG